MCEITGYSEEELLGMAFSDLTHPDDREDDLEGFRRVVRGEVPKYVAEKRYVRKDGSVAWVSVDTAIVRDGGGQPLRTVALIQDVTERKQAEEALKESEELFRSLVQNASDTITVVDAEGTVTYVSPAVDRVLGYRPEELVGKSAFDYVHPDDLEEVRGIFAKVSSESGFHPPFEFRVPHKDGSWRYLEYVVNNLLDGANVRGVVVNLHDITERRQAQKALKESEERFRLLIENSSDVISVFDAGGTILYQSPSIEGVLGHKPEDRIGKNVFETPLVHPADFGRKRDFFSRVINGSPGAPAKGEFRLRHSDGSWRYIEAVGKNLLADSRVNPDQAGGAL
jgi:PAS domain S-box-containing protein